MIRHILVADDERINALMLVRNLEKQGYTCSVAGNGIHALEIIKTHPIDLLITDVVMPEMDGVDLYMALKSNPVTANLPIIIATDKDVFQESFSALGVELYCPKPFNIHELLEKIKRIESKSAESHVFHKVVVIGSDSKVLEAMKLMLVDRSCIVATVDSVIEIGLRCFLISPSVIILDIHTQEYATTKEIIRSLRSYEFFKNTVILVYSNFSAGEASVISGLDSMDTEIHACMAAGATKYIGRFNRVTFVEQIKEFGL